MGRSTSEQVALRELHFTSRQFLFVPFPELSWRETDMQVCSVPVSLLWIFVFLVLLFLGFCLLFFFFYKGFTINSVITIILELLKIHPEFE